MTRRLAQRQVVLLGVTLLAVAVALAIITRTHAHALSLPAAEGSYTALAGRLSPRRLGKPTACGVVIGPGTEGIGSPVLPCGTNLYVTYRGIHVLTTVIARSPAGPGKEFDLTDSLATQLGIVGVKRIRWSYAAAD